MFKDILGKAFPLIEQFAPTIATALISKKAGLETELALEILQNIFHLDGVHPQDIPNKISSHPDVETALQSAEKKMIEQSF